MKVLAVFSSLPGGEVCSDTASFVGCTKYFCQYLGAHLLYGQMFLVVMSCLRTGFLWWQERNLMIFGCFQVMERKYLLSECFSFGDESKWGFLAMVIWPWKEQSYFLGRAVGVLRHRWHLVGKGRRRENWTCSSEVSSCNFIPCTRHRPWPFLLPNSSGKACGKGNAACLAVSLASNAGLQRAAEPSLWSQCCHQPRQQWVTLALGAVTLPLALPWPRGWVGLLGFESSGMVFGKGELAARSQPGCAQGVPKHRLWVSPSCGLKRSLFPSHSSIWSFAEEWLSLR